MLKHIIASDLEKKCLPWEQNEFKHMKQDFITLPSIIVNGLSESLKVHNL